LRVVLDTCILKLATFPADDNASALIYELAHAGPNNIGVLTIVVRAPSSLVVVSPALPADADRRGSSEEAMRNLYSYSEPVGVENRVAEEAAAYESEGLPNRLLNAREVAKFVGCHEETVRRAYWRGLLRSQRFGVRGRRFHPDDVLDWIRRGAPTKVS
jgi:excisionase family DNA binding protein